MTSGRDGEASHAAAGSPSPLRSAFTKGERFSLLSRENLLTFAGLWLLLAVYSFLRVPIPGVNEPHYLGKAKAFWDPRWCAGDLFLGSSNPHRAFYEFVGWMTRFLSLRDTAIVGRCAGLALLAWGWQHLCNALGLRRWQSFAALCIFLLIQTLGSWSGEWLVGGIESKVFSYGLAFAGMGAVLRRSWTAAGIWLGLSVTMHPLVGCWSTLIAGAGLVLSSLWRSAADAEPLPSWRRIAITALWWFVSAAPGIGWALPALRTDSVIEGQTADLVQVAYRLKHHLDPWTFPRESHRFFFCLIVIAWLLRVGRDRSARQVMFERMAIVAVAFGLLCCLFSYGPRPWPTPPLPAIAALQLKMLKFYPFRLPDLLVEVLVAMSAVQFLVCRSALASRDQSPLAPSARRPRLIAMPLLATAALVVSLIAPTSDQNPSRMTPGQQRDWLEAMTWLKTNTPPDALVYGERDDWAIKWYAERPEYVNFKDCPQDAAGVVEWNRRLLAFAEWTQTSSAGDGKFTAAELSELRKKTGIQYLIVTRLGPIEAEPVFANGSYRIYATEM